MVKNKSLFTREKRIFYINFKTIIEKKVGNFFGPTPGNKIAPDNKTEDLHGIIILLNSGLLPVITVH